MSEDGHVERVLGHHHVIEVAVVESVGPQDVVGLAPGWGDEAVEGDGVARRADVVVGL